MELETKLLIGLGVFTGGAVGVGLYEHYKSKPAARKPVDVSGILNSIYQTNTTSITLAPGTITAPSVGWIGSTLNILAPPAVAGVTPVMTAMCVDGHVMQGFGGFGNTYAAKTTRRAGTILVSWLDANSNTQNTAINYGKPVQTSAQQSIKLPAGGQDIVVNGAGGISGATITVTPPDPSLEFISPYQCEPQTWDYTTVDFAPGAGASVSMDTRHWSGHFIIAYPDAQGNVQNYNIYYGP